MKRAAAPTKRAAAPTTKKPTTTKSAQKKAERKPRRPPAGSVAALRIREIETLREELEGRRAELLPRWNADPDDARRSVAQLVLALVEFLRKLLERQAIRRMEKETLTPEEIERVGLALMRLEETVHDLARQFDLDPSELNLDLGPLGRLT